MKKILLVLAPLIFILIGCDDTITVQTVDNTIIPSSNVSFGKYIYPLLQVKCAFTGCHAGPSPAGNLDLTSWVNVTAYPDIVSPGDATNSRLVWAIKNTPGVQMMPPINTGLALTENQIQGIVTWINEGAKNN